MEPRIIFFGTPEFAVSSLDRLVSAGLPVVAVVTAPDKPSGRGLIIRPTPVGKFALEHNIPLLRPVSLKEEGFLKELRSFNPDIQVVVAFRLLPREVWSLPLLGTFNLHASLLPQYRGAAPINHAIINGERETGITTFFIDDRIDTGKIIARQKVEIDELETAGGLHDRLMDLGADLVLRTVRDIEDGNIHAKAQEELADPGMPLKPAPKLKKEDCRICWEGDVTSIANRIRGLSPYPGAYTVLPARDGSLHILKIFRASREVAAHSLAPGTLDSDGKSFLRVAASDGFIRLEEVQPAGRKAMIIGEFLRGFSRVFLGSLT